MTHEESKKQNDEQTKPNGSADGSLSDADLEHVAGGNGFGTRSGPSDDDPLLYFRRRRR